MYINSPESIRRKTTKLILGIRNLPYSDILVNLYVHPLERRRVRGNIIQVNNEQWGYIKEDLI